jgi:hypothetical protein
MDALREEEVSGAGIVELAPVVTLDSLDAGVELGRGVGDEGGECAECVRFQA